MPRIATDCLIPYGDQHYRRPSEHVDTNHFGPEVAGSRITAWPDFQSMWADIEPRLLPHLRPNAGVRALQLSFDRSVGLEGVLPLAEVPAQHLAVEERNGQPSLFCEAPDARKPTPLLTVVVGPSTVEPGAIEGYEGHDVEFALYTVYPGAPSKPFPRCSMEQQGTFHKGLLEAISVLQSGDIEGGQKALLAAYSELEGDPSFAEYWSQHVLIHGPTAS